MSRFLVGQKVTCVDDGGFNYTHGEMTPVFGETYTVREIERWPYEEDALRLMEIVNSKGHYLDMSGEACFLASRFEPVYVIEPLVDTEIPEEVH